MDEYIIQKKTEIRNEVLKLRSGISLQKRISCSFDIAEIFKKHPLFVKADILLCYAANGSELSTKRILSDAWICQKKVYLPKVDLSLGKPDMIFRRVDDWKELKPGYRGIQEPSEDAECLEPNALKSDRILMIVPGVAFDRQGNRLGYGKGFYDRFLQSFPDLQKRTVGIGFTCQLIPEIPVDISDQRLTEIICVG